MASIFNKRQQARNERTLQELIRTVPGNDRCADCQARNPGWASWSLGIFLCMRCAALHRKLGTHLSKVKSLSMDSWANEQVENMKKVGNTTSNRSYNPRNVRPDLPLDPDEIDIAMEKFIRAKYQSQILSSENTGRSASRNHTGSSASTEDRPPPVPAKNTPRFAPALRSVSSNIPSTQTNLAHERVASNTKAAADLGGQAGYDDQLARLREMGFVNEKRNLTLLKGLNGSLDRTIEALVRLGEGDDSVRIAAFTKNNGPPPPRVDFGGPTPSNTLPPASQNPTPQTTSNGAIQSSTATATAPASYTVSQNPNMPTPQKSYNPFDVPTPLQTQMQSNAALDLAFQNMTISQQPLSAHSTGSWQNPNQYNPFLKSYTPPMSPTPYQQPAPANMYPNYTNQVPQRSFTDPTIQSNPFLRSSRSQTFEPSGLSNQVYQTPPTLAGLYGQQSSTPPLPPMPTWVQTQRSLSQPQFQANPFGPSVNQNGNGVFATTAPQTQGQSQFSQLSASQQPFQQQQQQSQQIFSTSPFQSPGMQTPVSFEGQNSTEYPFNAQPLQSSQAAPQQQQMYTASAPGMTQPQIQPQQQQANPFPLAAMPTGATTQRFDKQSILALYNQSYAAPGGPQTATPQPPDASNLAQPMPNQPQPQPQAANNVPAAAYNNPFANLVGGQNLIGSHLREESKDFSALALNSNANGGRHSPEAFKSLSSRFR